MNRRERRKLQKQGVQVPKDPSINIKLSDLGRGIMTPAMESAMMHEINQQCLEADARFSLDLDTMVLWTLYQCYGWREKRLHDFYLAMAREHRRMREYYQMDDLYPERYKLKEKGIDVEKWQEEVLRDDPYFEDMEGLGERWTRNPDGTTKKVPANTTFAQWRQSFVQGPTPGLQHPPVDQARQAALCGLHRGLYRRRVPGHHPAQQAL